MEAFPLLLYMISSSANTTFSSFMDLKDKPYPLCIRGPGYKACSERDATAVFARFRFGRQEAGSSLCCRPFLWLCLRALVKETHGELTVTSPSPPRLQGHWDFLLPSSGTHLKSQFICHSAKERTSLLGCTVSPFPFEIGCVGILLSQ